MLSEELTNVRHPVLVMIRFEHCSFTIEGAVPAVISMLEFIQVNSIFFPKKQLSKNCSTILKTITIIFWQCSVLAERVYSEWPTIG